MRTPDVNQGRMKRISDHTRPAMYATQHPLHFEDLSAFDFERMFLWLLKAEGRDPEPPLVHV